jgi:hypothetical protein
MLEAGSSGNVKVLGKQGQCSDSINLRLQTYIKFFSIAPKSVRLYRSDFEAYLGIFGRSCGMDSLTRRNPWDRMIGPERTWDPAVPQKAAGHSTRSASAGR